MEDDMTLDQIKSQLLGYAPPQIALMSNEKKFILFPMLLETAICDESHCVRAQDIILEMPKPWLVENMEAVANDILDRGLTLNTGSSSICVQE